MFETYFSETKSTLVGRKNNFWLPHGYSTRTGKYLKAQQILALAGVRRCGKSTALKHLINFLVFLIHKKSINPKNILFINLENPVLATYKNDVRNLTSLYNKCLEITEPKGKVYMISLR